MSNRRGRPPHPDVLTPAEWRVVDAVRHGMTRRAIARRRGTSVDAVRYHLRNVATKLGTAGMRQLRDWEGYPTMTPIEPTGRRDEAAGGPDLGPVAQVSLLIRDVDRAVAFYRDTLELPHLYTFGTLTFFDLHGVRLYLQQVDEADWRPTSVIYLSVKDIAASYAALQARAVPTRGAPHLVHTHEDGTQEWMAFFEDTEGNTLALLARVTV